MLASTAAPILLQANMLACERGDRSLFSELCFEVGSGQLLQVLGANGSGKTSLLRILCGLLEADAGEVLWCGESVLLQRNDYLHQIHYAGHLHGIKLELTARENLHFAACMHGGKPQLDISDALEQVELYGFEDELAGSLSAGQRRRIGLASLLITQGRLWILDEPFTTLDSSGAAILERLIESHLNNGGCTVMASHSPHALDPTRIHTLQLTT